MTVSDASPVERRAIARAVALVFRERERLAPFRHNHAAVIFDDLELLADGVNRRLTDRTTIHAEAEALRRVGSHVDLRHCSMLVLSVTKTGRLRTSRPCERCTRRVSFTGFRRVVYSVKDGFEELT